MAAVLPNTTTGTALSGLARALVQANRLSAAQADMLHKKAIQEKTAFIDAVLASGAIEPRALAAFCAETFGYPLFDLSAFAPEFLPTSAIDARLMQAQRVIALAKRGNKLSVALSDPTNNQALDQIKFQSEATVEPVIVPHDALLNLLAAIAKGAEQAEGTRFYVDRRHDVGFFHKLTQGIPVHWLFFKGICSNKHNIFERRVCTGGARMTAASTIDLTNGPLLRQPVASRLKDTPWTVCEISWNRSRDASRN